MVFFLLLRWSALYGVNDSFADRPLYIRHQAILYFIYKYWNVSYKAFNYSGWGLRGLTVKNPQSLSLIGQ